MIGSKLGIETFWALIEKSAADHADRVLFADDYGRSLTAAEYRAAAEEVAAGLCLSPGQRVSWQLPTTLEAAVVLGALARVGCVQNPVIMMLRRREMQVIEAQHRPDLVIVPETWRGFDHAGMVNELGAPEVLALDLETDPGAGLRLPKGDPAHLPPPPEDAGIHRWTYFSSGTTGQPKGIRHSDSTVIASSSGMTGNLGIREGDVYPIAWPYPHIGGVSMTAAVLRTGGRLVLFDSFGPGTAARMARHRPTILGSAAPFFRAYLDAQNAHGPEPLYPALRAFTAGSAPTPASLVEEMRQTFGVAGLINAWGLTEFPIATSCRPDDPPDRLLTSVGQACPRVEVTVVDSELRLRGPQCFLGYTDQAMDAEAFDEQGRLRTGDLGEMDPSGYVTVTGRLKDVIIRNAENISALEVEDVVLAHPHVAEVAVVGVPDPVKGELVCAVVVLRPGGRVALADLVEHCRASGLARQKTPEAMEIVDELPRNSMGKILKQELRARLGAVRR